MTSILAAQLAQGVSLNASQLRERTRRKPIESYLFTGRDAAKHDFESLHALASTAFAQLVQLKPELSSFEDAFFSDSVKLLDRTLLPADATRELDAKIKAFLPALGRFLLDVPTSRVLEWMVRRFRHVVLVSSLKRLLNLLQSS
jgi:U3 small nucleolar RNA-associated protein 10